MKNTQLCNVVMLPTNEASKLYKYEPDNDALSYKETPQEVTENCSPQHLYLTSNEEIKEGDWTIFPNTSNGKITSYNPPVIAKSNYANNGGIYNCKVIATTDKSLPLDIKKDGGIIPTYVPFIPDSFVKAYVEAQGKITEVLVEYEEIKTGWLNDDDRMLEMSTGRFKLKLRPDNTVIIHEAKKYSREEMLQMYQLGRTDALESSMQKKMINNSEQNL